MQVRHMLRMNTVFVLFIVTCWMHLEVWGYKRADPEFAKEVRREVNRMLDEGNNLHVIEYLNNVEKEYGTIVLDNEVPSLFSHRGVAYHNANDLVNSELSFRRGVEVYEHDVRTWINLGEVRVHMFDLDGAVSAFRHATAYDDKRVKDAAYPRLLRSMGWSNIWEDWEEVTAHVEEYLMRCVDNPACSSDSSGGFEYTNAPGHVNRILAGRSPNSRDSPFKVSERLRAPLWKLKEQGRDSSTGVRRRLKLGFVSSDFGVHPVSSLIRGLLQFISEDYKDQIELYCFALRKDLSWWGLNITNTVEHFELLQPGNTQVAADQIARHGIEVLIDLNGHTLHSGLPVMSHRPAPVQISFLGLPTTTSAPFIDYYIGDYNALPAEMVDHFQEKLILMPGVVIANDYAQMQGDVLKYRGDKRASRDRYMDAEGMLDRVRVLFGTLSNYSKISPLMWQVFTNILRSVGGSKMMFLKYSGWLSSMPHLKQYAPHFGLTEDRLVFTSQAPWIEHLYMKTTFDMFLDTITKGGHTTGLDGMWAGVPTVTVPGRNMPARAGLSMAQTLGHDVGLTWSLKEFEDIAFRFARDKHALSAWRMEVENLRETSELYDTRLWTRRFVRLIQGCWESAVVAADSDPGKYGVKRNGNADFKYHVFSTTGDWDVGYGKNTPRTIPLRAEQVYHEGGIANVTKNVDLADLKPPSFREKSRQARRAKILRVEDQEPYSDIFTSKNVASRTDIPQNVTKDNNEDRFVNPPLPSDFFQKHSPALLNIGGLHKVDGWVIVNSQKGYNFEQDGFHVDVYRQMYDLEGFPNNSVGAVYGSHILEHASFGDGELGDTLTEWHRVLHPGGLLMISVPDLHTLATMYLDKKMTFEQRWMITRMMYGAQVDEYDFHKIGFDEAILHTFLRDHKFCNIERVHSFNLFQDTSEMSYGGYRISLNMVARPCKSSKPAIRDGFRMSHKATPYQRG